MGTSYLILFFIGIFALWAMWDDSKNTPAGRPYNYPEEFTFMSMDEDHKNLKKLITKSTNPQILNAAYQLIELFQEKYKGLEAEQKANELIGLYIEKQAEISSQN